MTNADVYFEKNKGLTIKIHDLPEENFEQSLEDIQKMLNEYFNAQFTLNFPECKDLVQGNPTFQCKGVFRPSTAGGFIPSELSQKLSKFVSNVTLHTNNAV